MHRLIAAAACVAYVAGAPAQPAAMPWLVTPEDSLSESEVADITKEVKASIADHTGHGSKTLHTVKQSVYQRSLSSNELHKDKYQEMHGVKGSVYQRALSSNELHKDKYQQMHAVKDSVYQRALSSNQLHKEKYARIQKVKALEAGIEAANRRVDEAVAAYELSLIHI